MPYTEADFERMDTDPEFRRQYFWRCAMNARRMVPEFSKNGDLRMAKTAARFSEAVLEYVRDSQPGS